MGVIIYLEKTNYSLFTVLKDEYSLCIHSNSSCKPAGILNFYPKFSQFPQVLSNVYQTQQLFYWYSRVYV